MAGGEGGIRTHGGLAPTAVFKTAALNHSATSPSSFGERAYRLARPSCARRAVNQAGLMRVLHSSLGSIEEGALADERLGDHGIVGGVARLVGAGAASGRAAAVQLAQTYRRRPPRYAQRPATSPWDTLQAAAGGARAAAGRARSDDPGQRPGPRPSTSGSSSSSGPSRSRAAAAAWSARSRLICAATSPRSLIRRGQRQLRRPL